MTNEEIARRLDMLDAYMTSHVLDYGEVNHRAMQEAIEALEQQPSDSNISDPCDGCRYELNSTNGNPCYSCGKYKLTEQQPSEDCISREAVLELAKKGILVSNDNYKCVVNAIKSLPSVTPQRPKGEWIEVLEHRDEFSSTWHYECSECRGRSYKGFEPLESYCPNCGAEMSGGEEDDYHNEIN